MQVYISRGIAGSGKNYIADQIIKNNSDKSSILCSADDYFMKNGVYIFDKDRLGAAHNYCLMKFIKSLEENYDIVICCNTNLSWDECKPYVIYADIMSAEIFLVEPQTPWRYDPSECFRKNQHGVPLETLQKMLQRMQSNQHIIEQAHLQFGAIIKEYRSI